MRYIVTVVIAALTVSTGSYAQHGYVYDLGIDSCGKYLAAVHGHRPGVGKVFHHPQRGQFFDEHLRYMAWLEGFFSATNLWVTTEPNGIQSDDAAIDVWIRRWCEQNPTKLLADAAWAFVWDQRREYLQEWMTRQSR